MKENKVIVIPHIPKTGGQTLRNHFHRYLLPGEFIHLGPWGRQMDKTSSQKPWEERPQREQLRARIILGHQVTKEKIEKVFRGYKQIAYITCLREPVERWVSEFNFKKKKDPLIPATLAVFFESFGAIEKNYQIYWIWRHFLSNGGDPNKLGIRKIYEIVRKELKKFTLVGCLEEFPSYQRKLCHELEIPECSGWDNRRGVDHPEVDKGTCDLRRRISQETVWDQRLIKELGLPQKKVLGPAIQKVPEA